jgi:hypothetical protein
LGAENRFFGRQGAPFFLHFPLPIDQWPALPQLSLRRANVSQINRWSISVNFY